MRTPTEVKDRIKVGARVRLIFCDRYSRDLQLVLRVTAVDGDGFTLESGTMVRWGRTGDFIVQRNGFTLLRDGRVHLQYVIEG